MKTCPDCAESVQDAARVCRYCGYRFDASQSEVAESPRSPAATKGGTRRPRSRVAVAGVLVGLGLAAVAGVLLATRTVERCVSESTGSPVPCSDGQAVPADASEEDVPSSSSEASTSEPDPSEIDQANWEAVLTKNAAEAARYCVRKVGAEIGAEDPPSRRLREAKNLLLTNTRLAFRDQPDLQVAGKPLDQYTLDNADVLRNGDCDTRGANKLEDLALGGGF